MAGAIASDLRGKDEENVFAFCILMCDRSLHSHLVYFHSFICDASLGLYSPARCTYLGLRRSIPGCAAAYQGGGYF